MEKITVSKKITINCINDIMLKCVTEKGYLLPCVSLKNHYGKKAVFTLYYSNNKPQRQEIEVLDHNNKAEAIYLIAH